MMPGLVILLFGTLIFGVMRGPVPLSFVQVLRAVMQPTGTSTSDVIVNAIREPRELTAMFVGAGLAVSGALAQSIFKNPMADPGIIGVSAGGALGAVIALALSWTIWSPFLLPVTAFVFAAMSVAVVYGLSTRRGKTSLAGALLAGLIVSSLIDSGISLILTFANNDQLRGIVFWLMGGFDGDGWPQVVMVAIPVAVGIGCTLLLTKELDLLATGEESAHSSGVSVEWTKRGLIALVALITGSAVAVSGMIAFVGLIVPHAARRMVGPRHRLVLPAAALLGGSLMVFADTIARALLPNTEISVGIVTSFVGGPFFLYLLLRSERRMQR